MLLTSFLISLSVGLLTSSNSWVEANFDRLRCRSRKPALGLRGYGLAGSGLMQVSGKLSGQGDQLN